MLKTTPVRIRMTHDEVKALEEISIELLGRKNKSRLVRKVVRDFIGFGPDLLDLQMAEFRQAVRQLSGMANNFNQVVRAINSNPQNLSRVTEERLENISNSINNLNSKLLNIINNTRSRKGIILEQKQK